MAFQPVSAHPSGAMTQSVRGPGQGILIFLEKGSITDSGKETPHHCRPHKFLDELQRFFHVRFPTCSAAKLQSILL